MTIVHELGAAMDLELTTPWPNALKPRESEHEGDLRPILRNLFEILVEQYALRQTISWAETKKQLYVTAGVNWVERTGGLAQAFYKLNALPEAPMISACVVDRNQLPVGSFFTQATALRLLPRTASTKKRLKFWIAYFDHYVEVHEPNTKAP